MRVNKAGADNLALAVDKLSASGCGEALANLGDAIGLDQDVCLSQRVHVILVVVEKQSAPLEQDCRCCRHSVWGAGENDLLGCGRNALWDLMSNLVLLGRCGMSE